MLYRNAHPIKTTIDLKFSKQTTTNSASSPKQTISNSKAPKIRRGFSKF